METFRTLSPYFQEKPKNPKLDYCSHLLLSTTGCHVGRLHGSRVILDDSSSAHTLQQMGCFGTYEMKDTKIVQIENNTFISFTAAGNSNDEETFTSADELDNCAELSAVKKEQQFTSGKDKLLHLCYEEVNRIRKLNVNEFYHHCLSEDNRFLCRYVAYQYYRSKHWVVKIGHNFGVDFVLYGGHPANFHSSYGVIVIDMDKISTERVTWRKWARSSRIFTSVKKELITCYIKRNEVATPDDSDIPLLSQFTVREVLVTQRFLGKHFDDG